MRRTCPMTLTLLGLYFLSSVRKCIGSLMPAIMPSSIGDFDIHPQTSQYHRHALMPHGKSSDANLCFAMSKQTQQTIIDDIFAWLLTFVSYLVLLSWQSFIVCVLPRFFLSYIPLRRRICANICYIEKCHFFEKWPHWRVYVLLNSNYHSRITHVRNRHWSLHMICELSTIGTYISRSIIIIFRHICKISSGPIKLMDEFNQPKA